MATLQLLPLAAIRGGATFASGQFIIASVTTTDRRKLILPKVEPSPADSTAAASALSRGCGWASGAADKGSDCKTSKNKKKVLHVHKSAAQGKPASVSRRNARERNRVKQVNQGFVTLASRVPASMRPKKMSKVETLKAAIRYISYLYDIVDQKPSEDQRTLEGGGGAAAVSSPPSSLSQSSAASEHRFETPTRPGGCGESSLSLLGQQHLSDFLALCGQPSLQYGRSLEGPALPTASAPLTASEAAYYDVPTCLLSPAPSAYDAPSPSGSVESSASGVSSETDSSYTESCLSPGSEELLDFASWLCTATS